MDQPKLLSTADVPHQFLNSAFLVGSVPFMSLRADPRVSYTLYIPPDHYNPDPRRSNTEDDQTLPAAYRLPQLPLVVTVHGTRRTAERCRNLLIPFAHSTPVAVLAPLFPVAPELPNSLDGYKLLRHKSLHADTALISMLDEVKERWPGIDTDKVFMMGFSGGGQFTQRFLYLYPERLHAVSIGAPGRVTRLDEERDWPAGIRNVADLFDGRGNDVDRIRQVRIQLAIGALDTETHGGTEFWEWLEGLKRKQSKGRSEERQRERVENRVATLRLAVEEWNKHGIEAEFTLVDNARHEYEKVLPAMVEFLRPLVEEIARCGELGRCNQ